MEKLKDDKIDSLTKTIALLKDGLDTIVTEILGKSWFDGSDMRGEGKARPKYPANSSGRDNTSPEKKKARAPMDETKPTCNECRRWITGRHTQDTCDYIKKRLPGYNESIEDFILNVKDHNISVGSEYNTRKTKELCKEIHQMIKRGR